MRPKYRPCCNKVCACNLIKNVLKHQYINIAIVVGDILDQKAKRSKAVKGFKAVYYLSIHSAQCK